MPPQKIYKFFYVLFFTVISIGLMCMACEKENKRFHIPDDESISSTSYSVSDLINEYDYDEDSFYIKPTRIPVLHKIKPIEQKPIKLPFSTNAHKNYLNDPLAFKNIPDGGVPSGNTAVVGSDVCLFYPVASISSMSDLAKLPKGEKIPFATIIPLGEQLQCKYSSYDNMFEFQDNYNFFFKTTWNGKQGIVFGADLYGDEDGIKKSNEKNRIISLLYKDNGHFSYFYSVTGYDAIREDIQKELETNGLSFQEIKKSEYYLDINSPDDMISLYRDIDININTNDRVTPIFITTDLAAHANHLVFDKLLQYCEEEYFFRQLFVVVNEYIKAIEQKKEEIPEAVYDTSLLYFQTAKALLLLAPRKNAYDYIEVNAAQVLSKFPEQVTKEIEQINNASGFGQSSVFPDMKEDYSQYKVRGHYTKNGILGAYFRVLMWFGRINFNLGGDTGSAKEAAKKLAPVALFITDITENSTEIKKLWQSLFDPITDIIGVSDDISFYELAPLWEKIKGAGFMQWYNDSSKLENFISKDYKELRTPAISGFSLFEGVYDGGSKPEDRRPPVGWRLFGQRYTLDSEIHNLVSAPRLYGRGMVQGLDIMKVFGSKTADRFLRTDYSKYSGLENTLNSLQKNMLKIKDDYWFSTYYTNILYQIKTQALFENGAGFYFTEKPNWNLKAMNSAHGTWAELRHDTILYVKQSFAEKAGGRVDPTYRIKPLPQPIHYIEPNTPFWIVSAVGIQKLYAVLEKYDFLDGKIAEVLVGLHEIFVKAAEISELEAADKQVSATDLEWIVKIPNKLAVHVMSMIAQSGGYFDDPDQMRMALVADVFTNGEVGVVLETAVGIPYRLYVPLNDKQGGKRIAVGYGFSYYEFTHPMSDRLNNAQWKNIVYKENPDMKNYLPFWMRGKVNQAK
ncbi:DUF3160 domain-containing protein [Treponema sp. R6D11]